MRIGYSNSSGSSNYCRVLFGLAIEFLRLSKPPDILGGIAASVAVLLSGWSLRQIRLCPDWIGSITPSKTHIKTKYRARSELVASFDDRIERFGDYDVLVVTVVDKSLPLGPDRDTDAMFRQVAADKVGDIIDRCAPGAIKMTYDNSNQVAEALIDACLRSYRG